MSDARLTSLTFICPQGHVTVLDARMVWFYAMGDYSDTHGYTAEATVGYSCAQCSRTYEVEIYSA